MQSVQAAAIYARISSDQTGEGLGVARQLEDCRKLAASKGWPVAAEYVDNDVSAYRGKARPEYQRMLADIEAGRIDAIVAYHQDRLTRQPIEFEQLAALCSRVGMDALATVTSNIAFGNDNEMLIARITAAVAANESARKSERVKRKILQNVEAGLPHGGSTRPFGYDDDRVTVREDEAAIIRELVARYLAGESMRSLTNWLNEQKVPTTGKATEWRTPTLRSILIGGRIAGLVVHHGKPAGTAAWPAIISIAQHEQMLSMQRSKQRAGRRAPRRYLLSGLLTCGRCENRLFSAARKESRRYVCSKGPDHGGCGRLTVVAAPVEAFVAEAILQRLDTIEMADVLAGRAAADERQTTLMQEVEAAHATLHELAEMFGAGEVSRAEWVAARKSGQRRLEQAQRQLDQIHSGHALHGLVGNGAALRAKWDSLNLDRQHAIVSAVLESAAIRPGTPGVQRFDHNRLDPIWVS